MTRKHTFWFFVVIASVFSSAASASPTHRRAHPSEFYARAPEVADVSPVADSPRAEARPDCFVSYTPVEVTRGIRHWTGKCH